MEKRKAVVFDLDGTLANIDHRLHHVQNKPKNYKAFYASIKEDKPIPWTIELLRTLSKTYSIVILTGRSEITYADTVEWFNTHVGFVPDLFMRKDEDHRPDTITKLDMYRKLVEPTFDVLFIVEDRDRMVQLWRSLGISCLQCDGGDY